MAGQGAALKASVAGIATLAPGAGQAIEALDPARTVRRALADARIKAFEVSVLVVSAELAPAPVAARAFARQALGPHGESVVVASVPADQVIGKAISEAREGIALAVVFSEPVIVVMCLEA